MTDERTTKTFRAAQRSHRLNVRKQAERDPLVIAVLARFPGAEITGVREVSSNPCQLGTSCPPQLTDDGGTK